MTAVQAWLALPTDVVLANSGETLGKAFVPSLLGPDTGAPAPTVAWSLRTSGMFASDTCLSFSIFVSGVDSIYSGVTPQTNTRCTVCVQSRSVQYQCAMNCPDSLLINARGDDVVPNPFRLQYGIINVGHVPGTAHFALLLLPAASGLSFDPSTPALQHIAKDSNPGDTVFVSWLVHVENRLTPRTVLLGDGIYDSTFNSNAMRCMHEVFIPGVNVLGIGTPATGAEGYSLHQNSPNPFSAATTVSYEIPRAMHVRLGVYDALGREVALIEDD